MGNIFQDILEKLQKSEKDMLINKSGSTRDSGNERIRSGQSYLYKLRGMESEVIEVRFFKNVRGDLLNRALTETMKRYPYFGTKLIEKDGDFYIVQNELSPVAKRTEKLARLGGIECGYRLIDVTYYGASVFISFHHALCDGRGVKPFVETLIWYYCSSRYKITDRAEGIRLAGDKLLDGETEDPFMHTYEYDKDKQFISLPRDGYALPENTVTDEEVNYRYEVMLPHDRFMSVCRERGATPVILLALTMSGAIADLYPDYDKPINANIAADMREALGCPNTFKNCVKSMILPYERSFAALPPEEQASKWRDTLNAQRDFDYCRREADSMLALFDKLDEMPSYEEKRKVMSFFEGMLLNTYVVSYLGQFVLGGSAPHIESIHLYNSGTAGLGINMISCGGSFVLDFKQSFPSDKYVKAFLRRLDGLNIEYSAGGAIPFSTPADRLIRRR